MGKARSATQWIKGQFGSPFGRPKRKHITELYERILENPELMKKAAIIKTLHKGKKTMVLQLREMANCTEGKMIQPIEADISVNLADAVAEARKRAAR